VPNVVGMGLKDALYLLENRRLKVKVVGVGKVKSQSVKAGKSIKAVQNITLVLG
jgi:cell division protein FtsI (penicillin-binding protein 3)